MKLNAVSSDQRQNKTLNNRNNNNPSFTGMSDAMVTFWRFVDAGGRGLQFTVEDMFGTNIPRTYKGAVAGYKYTGKVNIPALLQEAIREFLTGPTMTIAPYVILAGATALAGKNVGTHIECIEGLSNIAYNLAGEMKQTETSLDGEAFKNNFIQRAVEDMLKKSAGIDKVDNKDLDLSGFVENVQQYLGQENNIRKGGFFKNHAAKKAAKNKAADALDKLSESFEEFIKEHKSSYFDTDFSTAKFSLGESTTGATSFKNYVKYMGAFADDYAANVKQANNSSLVDLSTKAISSFKQNRIGKRALTVISMIGLTGIIMSFIPKIYTFFSGSVNPNAANIYKEAEKKGDK